MLRDRLQPREEMRIMTATHMYPPKILCFNESTKIELVSALVRK